MSLLFAAPFLLGGAGSASDAFTICEQARAPIRVVASVFCGNEATHSEEKVAEALHSVVAAVLALIARGGGPEELRAASTPLVHVDGTGQLQVYIILAKFQPQYVTQLKTLGAQIEITLPEYRLIQGWVPAQLIDRVAALDFVIEVRPPGYPVPRGNAIPAPPHS